MQLSPTNLAISRLPNQSTDLYLSIFTPQVVMACLISGTMANGARDIAYKSVSTGTYTNIESGMTMLVGTSAGSDDLGKIRVKSATASNIVVAENSHINWPLATHLTVLKYWELWPVYPRIINDPGNAENVIFYKDYDIAYTNQNSVLGAFPCAGTHRAGFAGDSFYFSATGTSHLLGSALSYQWTFEGGSPSSSTSETPGNVQFSTAGQYVVKLVVTGANGSSDTTYRYVSIYNRPESSLLKNPIRKWAIDGLAGSRGEGGYSTTIRIIDETVQTIRDGDVVVIWSDDYYGGNHISLGGNSPNNSSIFFVGHISNGSIRYNYRTSTTEFQVASITDLMKLTEGFSVSVESKASPSTWFELLDMDGRRAIYHYLKWHSTALLFNDFQFLGTDQKIQFFDSDRESIYDAIDNYMRGTLVGKLVADRQNKLWAEVSAWATSNPTGSYPPIQSITKADWTGEPTIQERLTLPMSYLEMGGVAFSGTTTGTFSALISCAPGETPNVRGSVQRQQGMALASQVQLNELTGNMYANQVSKYPSINMTMAGNYNHLDIAPQESVDINIASGDTNLGVPIHAPYLIDSVSWSISPTSHIKIPSIELISLVNGKAGETVTIPDVPDSGGYSDFGGGFDFAPGKFPPFLSTFANQISGKWVGAFNPSESGQEFFQVTGTYWNVGNFGVGAVGYGNQPIIPIGGLYLVTLNLKFLTATGGTYYSNIRVPSAEDTSAEMNYWVNPIASNTKSFTFADQKQYPAGYQIDIHSFGPSGGSGIFTLALNLLYTL